MLGRLVSTSASMCAAMSDSLSAATRAGRRSAIGGTLESLYQPTQREPVTVSAESADDRQRRISEVRMTALGLARIDVGDVQLDERNANADQRVADGETRVRICRRVHYRAIDPAAQRLHRVDHLAFPVVLREAELDSKLLRDFQEAALDVGKCPRPVKLRLTRAEQIEIGPID